MTHSFPHRMVAVVARIVLAIVEDLPASVADIACLVAVPVSLWLLHRLIVRTAAWIGGHVAAHRRQVGADALDEAFAAIVEHFDAIASDPMERSDGAAWIHPRTPLRRRDIRSLRRLRRIQQRHTPSATNSERTWP